MSMIEGIRNDSLLAPYVYSELKDAGIEVQVDSVLKEEEFAGIKVDEYYQAVEKTNTPKAVDFVVSVDCSCDSYRLYILEFKNVCSPKKLNITAIQEKFYNTIEDFLKNRYKEIFLSDRYKYKEIKLYLVSDAYGAVGEYKNHEEYRRVQEKIRGKDSLRVDWQLANRLYRLRNKILHIEYDIPPNPLITKMG